MKNSNYSTLASEYYSETALWQNHWSGPAKHETTLATTFLSAPDWIAPEYDWHYTVKSSVTGVGSLQFSDRDDYVTIHSGYWGVPTNDPLNDGFSYLDLGDGNNCVTADFNSNRIMVIGGEDRDTIINVRQAFGNGGDDYLAIYDLYDGFGEGSYSCLKGDYGNDTTVSYAEGGGVIHDGGYGLDKSYGSNDALDIFRFCKGDSTDSFNKVGYDTVHYFEVGLDKIDLGSAGVTSMDEICQSKYYDAELGMKMLEIDVHNKDILIRVELTHDVDKLSESDFILSNASGDYAASDDILSFF